MSKSDSTKKPDKGGSKKSPDEGKRDAKSAQAKKSDAKKSEVKKADTKKADAKQAGSKTGTKRRKLKFEVASAAEPTAVMPDQSASASDELRADDLDYAREPNLIPTDVGEAAPIRRRRTTITAEQAAAVDDSPIARAPARRSSRRTAQPKVSGEQPSRRRAQPRAANSAANQVRIRVPRDAAAQAEPVEGEGNPTANGGAEKE